MSQDSFTEVTGTGWFSRLGNAFKGVLAGLALLAIGVGVLFFNEGRAVKRAEDLDAGAGALVQAAADHVDAGHDGRLVHFTGNADTDETIADRSFDLSAEALRLRRRVEMFQWTEDKDTETRNKIGGGTETKTTYRYEKTWSEQPIRSSSFRQPEGHRNPVDMPFRSETQNAREVTVEAFELPQGLVSKLSEFRPIGPPVPDDPRYAAMGDLLYFSVDPQRPPDPGDPQIGDVRIGWSVVDPGAVSVIGVQRGTTLEPWTGPSGSEVFEIRAGTHSGEAMFGRLQTQNTTLTWILRGAGTIGLFIGFALIFAPLGVLADVLPLLGSLVRLGTGTIAFFLTATVSLTTIAVGWLTYRPLIGVPLLVVAAGGIVALVMLARRRRPEADTAGSVRPGTGTREAA